MKTASALACLALVAGCADAPRQGPANWGYQPGQQAPSVISETEFEQLTSQVIDFRNQRNTLAGIVRTTQDANVRSQHLRSIDDLNGKIQMLEYRLRAAGRPLPRG